MFLGVGVAWASFCAVRGLEWSREFRFLCYIYELGGSNKFGSSWGVGC